MKEHSDLQQHITQGVEKIVSDALKATWKDPRQSAFMVKFAAASRKADKRRLALEQEGSHVPAFLIASITSRCNLHCAGCYSRCINSTSDEAPTDQLTGEQWQKVFREAEELGVSFILLAGGEPMIRRDVIQAAGETPNILFPIFTNGTFFNAGYRDLFDRCRNLVPVLSIEGGRDTTDARRGGGMYDKLLGLMDDFGRKGQLFGASITVTTENIAEVTSEEFIGELVSRGCKLVLFIEFVPVTDDARHLAPGEKERALLEQASADLRQRFDDVILLSFPGDELAMGGCMAAGREFFHINSHGGAEPCPFSPFSDVNVRDTSLREAMNSPLFYAMRDEGMLLDDHEGGCVLYEKRDQVQALLSRLTSRE